jgi:hypothetical protein
MSQKTVPLLATGPACTVPATEFGWVPASVVTPFVLVTAFHTFAFRTVSTVAPRANGTGVGAGGGVVGGGVVGGGGGVAAEQPLTLITGTVPDEENATVHPIGATT